MQSVAITSEVVSSNPTRGEVYTIQHYVTKVCQWLTTGRWFSPVSSTNKTDRHDITEILLKVVLNTIILHPRLICVVPFCLSSFDLRLQIVPLVSSTFSYITWRRYFVTDLQYSLLMFYEVDINVHFFVHSFL